MEEKILLLIQFGLELFRMWIGMRMIFGFQLIRKWIAALMYGIFTIVLFANMIHVSDMGVIMWLLIFFLFIITVKTPVSKDWKWKLLCGFVLLYQEELICMIVGDGLHFCWNELTLEEEETITSIVALITIGAVGYFYKKSRNEFGDEKKAKSLQKIMIPLIIFVSMELMLVIVCLNYMLKTSDNIKAHVMSMILSILAMVSVGVLFAVVAYVKNANEKMEQMLKMEQRMKQLEIEHYETLLRREENTKRYRHDIIHHLIRMEQMLHNREIEEVGKYVGEMLSHIQHIRDCDYNTGNKTLNTILNYYIAQLSEEVEVCVKGKCKKEIQVSEYDMSTIFANLFKNAVEAIRISGQANPMLSVEIEEGKTFVKIIIINSMKPNGITYDKEGNIQTTKKDKSNHGMGLLNVKDAIQKNKGVYECFATEGQFCCRVSLRVKNLEK